jgi:formylglycine-generating enzyme required for sulfatase activity
MNVREGDNALRGWMEDNKTTTRMDKLPPMWAGLAGCGVFFGAGLLVIGLPTWGFVPGLLGLVALLVWLALSGKPVVKLTWETAPTGPKPAEPKPAEPKPKHEAPSAPEPLHRDDLLDMVELPGGEFFVGSPEEEQGRSPDEKRHRVEVSAFAMAKYPVTQKQYQEVMGWNPSYFREAPADGTRAEDRPVEQVTWFFAVRFCNELSERAGRKPCYRIIESQESSGAAPQVEWDREADGYRLPTEAEWEYACRAGTETAYSFGDDEAQLDDHAWCASNSGHMTHAVGQKKPNRWGFHDLHGNVWEWCWDWYEGNKVTSDTSVTLTNPMGPPTGSSRVLRGGSFVSEPRVLRSASRVRDEPEDWFRFFGFRCVRGSGRQR